MPIQSAGKKAQSQPQDPYTNIEKARESGRPGRKRNCRLRRLPIIWRKCFDVRVTSCLYLEKLPLLQANAFPKVRHSCKQADIVQRGHFVKECRIGICGIGWWSFHTHLRLEKAQQSRLKGSMPSDTVSNVRMSVEKETGGQSPGSSSSHTSTQHCDSRSCGIRDVHQDCLLSENAPTLKLGTGLTGCKGHLGGYLRRVLVSRPLLEKLTPSRDIGLPGQPSNLDRVDTRPAVMADLALPVGVPPLQASIPR